MSGKSHWWTIRQLRSDNSVTRAKAAEKLAKSAGPELVGALRPLLKDSRAERRLSAVQALAGFKIPEAYRELAAALQDDDVLVRELAASALAEAGDPDLLTSLLASLHDKSIKVRRMAVRGLGNIKDNRVVEPMIPLMDDEDFSVRAEVAKAFEKVGSEMVRPFLLEMLHDTNEFVQRAAASALSRIDILRQSLVETGLASGQYWFRQVKHSVLEPLPGQLKAALSESDQEYQPHTEQEKRILEVRTLIPVLEDPDPDIRESAAEQLGRLGEPLALAPLSLLLEDPEEAVKQAARQAIGRIRDQVTSPETDAQKYYRIVDLQELIQLECSNRKSSILEILAGDDTGQIFIREGAIIHAQYRDQKGVDAFNELLCLLFGKFQLLPFREPSETTIRNRWELLVKEATRQRAKLEAGWSRSSE